MIYLDHAASSPLRPVARLALLESLEGMANAAGRHALGRLASRRVEIARQAVAELAACEASEVVFTAGGTEANNLAIWGTASAIEARGGARRAVLSALEHACVRKPFERLARQGWEIETLAVDSMGRFDGNELRRLLKGKPSLVSLMAVNNEMGVVQNLETWGPEVRASGAALHVDAVQALGYLAPENWAASLVTLSAHKLGGPQGVGALILRRDTPWEPVLLGGPHEQGRRPGTLAVPAIASFGAAAREALSTRDVETVRLKGLNSLMAEELLNRVPNLRLIGDTETRAPHILAVSLPGSSASFLLEELDMLGIAASSGAACSSLKQDPSPVLESMGLTAAEIEGSIRFSLGWSTTESEIREALHRMIPVMVRASNFTPRIT